MRRRSVPVLLVGFAIGIAGTSLMAAEVDETNFTTFQANTTAVASEVNDNFTAIKDAVNDNARSISASFGGDASAGNFTAIGSVNWVNSPPANPNFDDFTISAGATLTVPAGTTIRCAGNFVNDGTLNVSTGADKQGSGFTTTNDSTYNGRATSNGHPGDSYAPASSPEWHNDFTANNVRVDGGIGGAPIPRMAAISSFNSFRIGGGSGSGHAGGSEGGGLVKIYCNGSITNGGDINADGANGNSAAGGGGGGIVILGSQTTVTNAGGAISATVGAGGGGSSWGGHGGGGGGGIVVFVAPLVDAVLGTITVTGGAAGTSGTTTATSNTRIGGGGGGASGGNGGNGATIQTDSSIGTATTGSNGYSVQVEANPAGML